MSSQLEFSYKIFPSHHTSEKKELKKFWIDCFVKPSICLKYKNSVIINFLDDLAIKSIEWYGDCILCKIQNQSKVEYLVRIFCFQFTLILEISPEMNKFVKIHKDVIQNLNATHEITNSIHIISFSKQNEFDLSIINIKSLINQKLREIDEWNKKLPKTNQYVNKQVWDFHWVLHKFNRIPNNFTEDSTLFSSCWPYSNKITPWNLLHIIEDLMWFQPNFAKKQLKIFFKKWQQDDGCIKNGEMDGSSISLPPIWSILLLEFSKLTGDKKIISELYPLCKKNLIWWEENRFNKDFNLFGANLSVEDLGKEVKNENSPRFSQQFDGNSWCSKSLSDNRSMLLIDLNAQMCDYYQNMGALSLITGDNNSLEYFKKAESLQENSQKYLWDSKIQFYFDYDLDTRNLQPMKTIAGFWSLYGGLASKNNIKHLIDHLLNPNEFWCELPIPTMAFDEPFYSNEVWHGPVLLSQNYWILNGLKRYNLNHQVAQISSRIFKYLNHSFDLHGGIYGFYPPQNHDIKSIIVPKSEKCYGYNLGQTPIHSIFYRGILGAEILDDSINFVPDWSVLKEKVNFSFYYRGKKIEACLNNTDKKMAEFKAD